MTTVKNNYVDNGKLYATLVDWLQNRPSEKMPDYIGRCIMDICTNIVNRPNFSGYTWKEDFIGDGILHCVRAAKNFDYTKSKNPFGYFSQIAFNACRRRIKQENSHNVTKSRMMMQSGVMDTLGEICCSDEDNINAMVMTILTENKDYFEKMESKGQTQPKVKVHSHVDLGEFFNDED